MPSTGLSVYSLYKAANAIAHYSLGYDGDDNNNNERSEHVVRIIQGFFLFISGEWRRDFRP